MNPAASPPLPLRDIHLPDPVSWWPLAPGWWMLLAMIIVLGAALWFGFQRWQKKRQRRDSLKALDELRAQYEQHRDNAKLLRELSVLMRRACITFYPRHTTASLTGDAWLQFLDTTSGNNGFSQGDGRLLATAPYLREDASVAIDGHALLKLCEHWLGAQPNNKYLARARAAELIAGRGA